MTPNVLQVTTAQGLRVDIELAHIGARSYAFIIDWHIRLLLALAWFLAGILLFGGVAMLSDITNSEADWSTLGYWVFLPSIAIYLLYHPLLEMIFRGSTPGKRMAGVRVVDLHGEPPSIGAIAIRNVLRLVDSAPMFYLIGLLCCAINRHHARIGDLAAGTLLVYERSVSRAAFESVAVDGARALSLKQRALLRELLERWPALTDAVRIRAAQQLLRQLGVATDGDSKALKAKLEASARG